MAHRAARQAQLRAAEAIWLSRDQAAGHGELPGAWWTDRQVGSVVRMAALAAGRWTAVGCLSGARQDREGDPCAARTSNPSQSRLTAARPACSSGPSCSQARISAFRRWLQDRPEAVVVAVGHSSFWRSFEEVCRGCKPERMRNCEFRLIHF